MSEQEYAMPASIQAEAGVIGAALIDGGIVGHLPWLIPEMFTHPGYQLTWEAMRALVRDGAAVDITTVLDRMERMSRDASEYATLAFQAVAETPHSGHARHYASIVLKKHQQRELIRLAHRLTTDAFGDADPELVTQGGMQRLSQIMALSPDHTTGRKTYGEVLDALHEDVLGRMDNPHRAIRSGFPRIDAWTGGFEPGQLILIAARPGAGKSALGLSMSRRMAGHAHHTGRGAVDIVTMEMTMIAQARRIIAARNLPPLDTRLMRQGFREYDQIDEIAYARFIRDLEADREDVGDSLAFHEGVISTDQLAVLANEAKVNHKTFALVIDQLDLFADTSKEGETQRIASISRRLKHIAMRLGIVIICLVQLNRETERRSGGDKRPQLSDLKQSGNLEQDADMVLALYRPSYYFAPDDDMNEREAAAYSEWAELLTLKHRDGQAGIVTPLRFIGAAASYTDWDDEAFMIRDMMDLVAARERRG